MIRQLTGGQIVQFGEEKRDDEVMRGLRSCRGRELIPSWSSSELTVTDRRDEIWCCSRASPKSFGISRLQRNKVSIVP